MKLVDKIMDYIMPVSGEPEDDFEDELEDVAPEKSAKAEKKSEPVKVEKKPEVVKKEEVVQTEIPEIKVGNGASIPIASEPVTTSFPSFSTTSSFQSSTTKQKPQSRPAKVAELNVKVYSPLYFNEIVQRAADDLLSKCAVVVNYEQSNSSTQQRISDFLDGVCYIKDGSTRKISDKIILYAPSGVDTEAALSVAMS